MGLEQGFWKGGSMISREGGAIREKGYTMKPCNTYSFTLFMRSQTLGRKTNILVYRTGIIIGCKILKLSLVSVVLPIH